MRALGNNKINPLLPIGLVIFSFNQAPFASGALAKQLATLAMIFLAVSILAWCHKTKFTLRPAPVIILLIFCCYMLVVVLVSGIIGQDFIIRDLAELARIFGLMVFLVLGCMSYQRVQIRHINIFVMIFLVVSVIYIAHWILGGVLPTFLWELYISRGGRFSGFSASVNYAWVVVPVVLMLVIYSSKNSALSKWMLLPAVIVVSLLIVILSGSRSGALSLLLGILFFILIASANAIRSFWYMALTVIMLLIVFNVVGYFETFDRFIRRFSDLENAILAFDLLLVPAFDARFISWEIKLTEIDLTGYAFLFGHGSAKTGITIWDNTYLTTLYRYGVLGLFIELVFYISLLAACLKRLRHNRLVSILIVFLIAYLISGVVANPFYELKTPYLLAFLTGWLSQVPRSSGNVTLMTLKHDYIKPLPRSSNVRGVFL